MKIETKRVKLSDLNLNPDNPRTISTKDMDRLVKSLQEFPEMMEIREVVCDEDYVVIGGNMRTLALRKAGAKEAVAKIVTGLSDEKKREFVIKDNGTNWGEWDMDALSSSWSDLPLTDWGVDLPEDWMTPDGGAGLTDPDEVPEPPKVAITKPGDIWLCGKHRVMCGDSTKAEDVERLMGGVKADMVFTDPPYGVNYDGGVQVVREHLEGDDNTALYDPCCKMAEAFSKNNAALYLWHAYTKAAAAAAESNGWVIRSLVIWNKNMAQYGALSAQYKQKHEPCLYCYKKGQTVNWNGPTTEVTVWDIDRASKNEFHPTQKPVALAERAIGNHKCTNILDLFGGSGSTLIAAEQTGRTAYLMEIDCLYVDVTVQRFEDFTGEKATLEA